VVASGLPSELLNDSLIFSSQVGKLFRNRPWLTVAEVLQALGTRHEARGYRIEARDTRQ
jgi:hypothetical protein